MLNNYNSDDEMVTLSELSASSVATLMAIVGTPIMTLFGWVQIQLSSLKSELGSKMSKSDAESLKESVLIRHENIQERLDKIEQSFNKLDIKLDKIIDRLIKHPDPK